MDNEVLDSTMMSPSHYSQEQQQLNQCPTAAIAATAFSPTIENRLQDAKRTIRDVTNQTLQSIAGDSHSIVLGDLKKVVESDCNNDPDGDDGGDDLAAALFEEDLSSQIENRALVSEEINKRLSSIEAQLGLYCDNNDNAAASFSANTAATFGRDHDYEHLYSNANSSFGSPAGDDGMNNANANVDFSSLTVDSASSEVSSSNHNTKQRQQEQKLELALKKEASDLKLKIHFLQSCTEARMALDELDSFAQMKNANLASANAQYPISQSSADITDNNISNNSMDSTDTNLITKIPNQHHKRHAHLIPMAKCLSKAQIALHQAEQYLTTSLPSSSTKHNNNTRQRDQQVANQILESIRLHIISKIADLNAKVTAIIQECIQIRSHEIVIVSTISETKKNTSPTQHNLNSPSSKNRKNHALKIAFKVLSILSESTSTMTSSATNGYVDKLSSRFQSIANDIKLEIIKPIIQQIRTSLLSSKHDNNHNHRPKSFHCQEIESLNLPSSLGLGHGTTTRRNSKMKQNVITLKWQERGHGNTNSSGSTENDDNDSDDLSWWTHLLEFIQDVLTFIHKHILFEDEQLSKLFGTSFFLEPDLVSINYRTSLQQQQQYDQSPLLQVLITLIGDECIPNDITPTSITKLPKVMDVLSTTTLSFESYLIENHFIDKKYDGVEIAGTTITNYSKTIRLSDFAKSVITTFAEKQRLRLLTQGRSLLLDSDYHNTMRVGTSIHQTKRKNKPSYYDDIIGLLNRDINDDTSTYVLHECSISVVAADLVKLCEQTMDDAVNTDFSVNDELKQLLPNMLYRAARELFDLYRAVIPATYGKEISNIPRTAAVLHNDCVYFAHRLLTLGLEYRNKFPGEDSPVKCTFIDLVPMLRELADQTMTNMIKHQLQQVSEIVQPRLIYLVDSLLSNEAVTEWTDAEMALQGGMYHLKHLSQSWWKVLSYEIYCRTMGNLVDTLFTLFLNELMKSKDISEPACHFVFSLFRDAIQGAAELFAMDQNVVDAMKEAARYSNTWHKFDAIGKFMNMSISDITMNLSKGTFREITSLELSRMVLAVFENSERRQKLLHQLANTSSEESSSRM